MFDRFRRPCTNPDVLRGAALLDERGPNMWYEKIDTGQLSLVSSSHCVLGQLYNGDFLSHDLMPGGWLDLPHNGFALDAYPGILVAHRRLKREWKRAIRARKVCS